jgi:hypothetical protein
MQDAPIGYYVMGVLMSRSVKKHSFIGYSKRSSENNLKKTCHRTERSAVRSILRSRNIDELDTYTFPTKQIHSSDTWCDSIRDMDSKTYFGYMRYINSISTVWTFKAENNRTTYFKEIHGDGRSYSCYKFILYLHRIKKYKEWMRK